MVAIVAKEKRLEEVSDSGCQATLFAHLEPGFWAVEKMENFKAGEEGSSCAAVATKGKATGLASELTIVRISAEQPLLSHRQMRALVSRC